MEPKGIHVTVDGRSKFPDLLDDPLTLERILRKCCEESKATVLSVTFHKFDPQGVTMIALLSESHASLHTYPEHKSIMADFFTCGDCDARKAAMSFCWELGLENAKVKVTERKV